MTPDNNNSTSQELAAAALGAADNLHAAPTQQPAGSHATEQPAAPGRQWSNSGLDASGIAPDAIAAGAAADVDAHGLAGHAGQLQDAARPYGDEDPTLPDGSAEEEGSDHAASTLKHPAGDLSAPGRARFVSEETLQDAVISVFNSGRTPSVRLVREALQGRGSSDRIQRAIEEWKRSRMSATSSGLVIPDVPPHIAQLMGKMWAVCNTAAHEAALDRLADKEANLREEAARLGEKINAANAKVLEAQNETARATARADGLSEQVAMLRAHIEKQDEHVLQLTASNKDLQASIVSGRETLAAALQDQDRHRAEHEAALQHMNTQLKASAEQTEEVRAEMKADRQQLMARNEKLQTQLDETREALTSATIRAATLETERNMLKSQLDSK